MLVSYAETTSWGTETWNARFGKIPVNRFSILAWWLSAHYLNAAIPNPTKSGWTIHMFEVCERGLVLKIKNENGDSGTISVELTEAEMEQLSIEGNS